MEQTEIERIKGGVGRAILKEPKNQILRDLEASILTVEQLQAKLADANLQVDDLKKALVDECRGAACGPECAGGYRKCFGCEKRAQVAYGGKLPWEHVIEKRICEHEWVAGKGLSIAFAQCRKCNEARA